MEQKQKIISETLVLTMKYGIKSVSMDDISKQLGISKKTLYQHFENKKELIREMVNCAIDNDKCDVTNITADCNNAIEEIINIARHFLQFLRNMSPTLTYDMQKYYMDEWRIIEDHHQTFIYSVIKSNIERGIAEELYQQDIDADIVAKLYVQLSDCITNENYFPLKEYAKDQLYKSLITYHIRGLVSDKGRSIIKTIELD